MQIHIKYILIKLSMQIHTLKYQNNIGIRLDPMIAKKRAKRINSFCPFANYIRLTLQISRLRNIYKII